MYFSSDFFAPISFNIINFYILVSDFTNKALILQTNFLSSKYPKKILQIAKHKKEGLYIAIYIIYQRILTL